MDSKRLPINPPKEITDKYEIDNTILTREVKDNPRDRITIEIGDSKQSAFKPQVKIMRWDNEVNFSLRAEETVNATVEFEGEKIKYITPDYEVHLYDKPDADEDGGFEFEWVLNKKPDTNILQGTIQSKDINFFKQPSFKEKYQVGQLHEGREIAVVNDHEVIDTNGNIVAGFAHGEAGVNSYAAYHKTKGRINKTGDKDYKTGKALHIYRPKATDANGSEAWCELDINEQTGTLSVTVPQEFLDKAAYPIIVDPTFGNTNAGGSFVNSGFVRTSDFSLTEDGTITQFSYYIDEGSSGQQTAAAVYDDNATSGEPGDLIGSSDVMAGTTGAGWRNADANISLTTDNWWLAHWQESARDVYYDASSGNGASFGGTFPTWNDPAGTLDTNDSNLYSIYATYTAISVEIEQEGFAFGDDDGNEASHTLDTQDTNVTEPLGTKTLRLLLNADGDPASIAYKLKYQKDGSGGYADVPTVASSGGDDLVIAATDTYEDGSNATSADIDITLPAYSAGDLVIICYNLWSNSGTPTVTWASGPDSETVTDLINSYGTAGAGGVYIAIGWYIATDNYAGGEMANDSSVSTRWAAAMVVVPAGEFDATTPISTAVGLDQSASDDTTPDFAGFSAGATDGGGKLLAFIAVDQDPISGTPSGWTDFEDQDYGRSSMVLSGRDTAVSDSETISASGGWTIASDAWAVYAFIVRTAPATDNELYISASANVTAGGEATTARLTAPSGKTTGDFDTGRRWDDENGSDSIDITADDYTELEWVLTTQSPAANDDYFEFRVYNADTALTTYTLTPKWTIGTGGGGSTAVKDLIGGLGIVPFAR